MAKGGPFQFSQVPVADIPRSSFNRSHGHKTTFDSGYLVPIYVDEALPGDTFHLSLSAFARLATPVVPIMDNLYMDFFFFAVPNRLVWKNWQKFMGETDHPYSYQPGDMPTDYTVPQVRASVDGFGELTLFDYMGLPTKVPNLAVSALPLRAYNLIWNEWFRDQNLQDPVIVLTDDGPDSLTEFTLQRRGKRHDYFTSALPWPQKGPGVEIPIGATAPVVRTLQNALPTVVIGSNRNVGIGIAPSADPTHAPANIYAGSIPATSIDFEWGDQTGLMADLSSATAITINQLRLAFQWQKLQERDARGGTRYTEILRAHFGVVSPDSRLQRPEYLGGGSVPVVINPVTQTSQTPTDPSAVTNTPQGNLAAYGVAGAGGVGFSKSFVEHSIILGLVNIRADLSYQYGLHRMWSRKTKLEFYWPALAHLGEQDIKAKEIFATGVDVQDDAVWGYQERWAEYRYFPSIITGRFRSNATGTLDYWHLAEKSATAPVLGPDFIEVVPPIDRIIAVTTEPQFIFDSHFRIKCVRPMPAYSVPGYIDHF